jgi:hypothetical protein
MDILADSADVHAITTEEGGQPLRKRLRTLNTASMVSPRQSAIVRSSSASRRRRGGTASAIDESGEHRGSTSARGRREGREQVS